MPQIVVPEFYYKPTINFSDIENFYQKMNDTERKITDSK